MTTHTTVKQEKQGIRGMLAMTGVTLAVVSSVVFWQLRPTGDTAVPTTANSSGVRDARSPIAVRPALYDEEPEAVPSDAEMYSRLQSAAGTTASPGVWAERYAEPLAGGAGPVAPAGVASMGAMEDATTGVSVDQHRARSVCGVEEQSLSC